MNVRSAFVVCMIAMCAGGCATVRNVYTARYEDCTISGDMKPHTKAFAAGSVPVVCVHGYGGKTVTTKLVDVANNRTIKIDTTRIAAKRNLFLPLEGIAGGSYKVDIYTDGMLRDTSAFTIGR